VVKGFVLGRPCHLGFESFELAEHSLIALEVLEPELDHRLECILGVISSGLFTLESTLSEL